MLASALSRLKIQGPAMKRIILPAVFLFSALPLVTHAADCTGGGTRVTAGTILAGNTVCARAASGTDSWQEWHQGSASAGGTLTEYAKGPADPNDPTHDVGSWSPSGDDVTYSYTSGGSYTFELWQPAGSTSYTFCEAGAGSATVAVIDALIPGQASCAAAP